MSIGQGPKSILLWSQMHGDEPSATPAVLDLIDYLARESARPEIAKILAAFTLRIIPMLNPDGAALYERRNLQGIDINRDALMLDDSRGHSPEVDPRPFLAHPRLQSPRPGPPDHGR